MAALRAVPHAVLVLLDMEEEPKRHLMRQAMFHGISARRVTFIRHAGESFDSYL